jgi:PGF-CTERM protein
MNRTAVLALLTLGILAVGVTAIPAGAQDAGNETQNATETVVVEAMLVGTTAENVTADDADALDQEVATQLGISSEQVAVVESGGSTAVEVRRADVTPSMLADAIEAAGASVDRGDVRAGVTDRTRDRTATIVGARLRAASEFNGSVTRVESDRLYVNVTREVNDTGLDALFQRGEVQVYARTPDGEQAELFTQAELNQSLNVRVFENFSVVPVGMTSEGVSQFNSELRRLNFTGEGVDACEGQPAANATGYCLETRLNGEVITRYGIGPRLAQAVDFGTFTVREFHGVVTANESQARTLRIAAVTRPLQTDVTIASVDDADAVSVEPNWPPDNDGTDSDGDDSDGTDNDGTDSTQTPADTTTATDGNGTDDGSGSSGPGFTPLVALAGIVVALLALGRRR